MKTKICHICGNEFAKKTDVSRKRWDKAKYCSYKCMGIVKRTENKGSKSGLWKGGRCQSRFGYILIYNPDHPNANRRGQIMEHRLVMEKHLGRLLTRKEVIHHINGKRSDNRIENLVLFTNNGKHLSFEKKGIRFSANHCKKISIGLKRFHANHKSL